MTELRKKLNVATTRKESFFIKVFGKSKSTFQKCDIGALIVFTRNNETLI